MDEKIRKALDKFFSNDNDSRQMAIDAGVFIRDLKLDKDYSLIALGFYAGYRAALDALPSREEIGQLLCDEINGSCGCPPVGIDYAAERIDALIRGKE